MKTQILAFYSKYQIWVNAILLILAGWGIYKMATKKRR